MTPEKRLSYIQRAIEIHNGKYDYSLAFPQNTKEKVTIICPEHGEFQQNFNSHIYQKAGCPICSGKYSYDTDDLIKRLKSVFGEKYDYSKTAYNGANEKVIVTCPEHGDFVAYPRHLLNGHGCPECGSAKSQNTRNKGNEKFIEEAQKVHNGKYDYSKVNYVNCYTKVCIICPEHGEFWQTPNNHLRGKGCSECAHSASRIKEQDFIERAKEIHNNLYSYQNVKYIGLDKNVEIICSKHGSFYQTPHNHLNGHGCPECAREQNSIKNRSTTEEFITKAMKIHKQYYDYSDTIYVNSTTPVKIICPQHGDFFQKPTLHLQGCGCALCGQEKNKKLYVKTLDNFINDAKNIHGNKYDYSKVEYINAKTKVCIICPEHGEFWQTPNMHLYGQGCPKCQHQQSKAELEIVDYLRTIVPSEEVLERNRELLDGREIDIFLPKYHLGIEYNGLHWHSLKMKPDLNYHRDKMKLANSKGYRLIQIFEDEWLEHRDIVLNKLKHTVGGDENNATIGARKCVVELIDSETADDFLNAYHIQGFVGSTIYLGAYYGSELVGVMTLKEESAKMWNLTRFATKTDYKLPGLANKMLKFFTSHFEIIEIKSFLDLRWNQCLGGNTVYDKLGFVLEKYTRPDYRYIVDNKRMHKFGFRKQTLHKKYGLPLTMTEKEMCDQLGFDRIYDCGLAKYVWRKEKSTQINVSL